MDFWTGALLVIVLFGLPALWFYLWWIDPKSEEQASNFWGIVFLILGLIVFYIFMRLVILGLWLFALALPLILIGMFIYWLFKKEKK